jgi:hypothetical protein
MAAALATVDQPAHHSRHRNRGFGVSVNFTHAKVARDPKPPAPRTPRAEPKPAPVEAPAIVAPVVEIKGRVLAIVDDYDALWSAVRTRVEAMGITRHTLDHISGMQEGYSGKVLGPKKIKKFGPESLGATLGAICCKLVLVEDPEATVKIQAIAKAFSTAATALEITVEKFVRIGELQPAPSNGMTSVGETLSAIGCKMALVEDPDATAKIMARCEQRKRPLRPAAMEPR